jgi:hypothetical protein
MGAAARGLLSVTATLGLTFAFGDVLNLSTGIDTTGSGCDAHWTVSATLQPGEAAFVEPPDMPFVTACPGDAAQVVTSTDADWFSPLPTNTSASSWIARNANITANGDDNYLISFWLDSAAGDSLNGFAAIEDLGVIYLNGHRITNGITWQTLQPVSYVSHRVNDYFQAGWNTLIVQIAESDNWKESVRFQGTVTGAGASFSDPPAVPEPSFAAPLLLVGLVAVPLALRRRRASA